MSFSFNISLSVLNHLGRNLYRNFITVIGEAISNSWDADARNVWIDIDREARSMFISDDGVGMTSDDFQNKFLKIGYSKRKSDQNTTNTGRPYIGRKGIGKLALLSCAQRVHIVSKTTQSDIVGGLIDNSGLDEAIRDDLTASEYVLKDSDSRVHEKLKVLQSGTAIFFEDLNDGVVNTIDYLKKAIALNFRFSLIDKDFSIYLNGEVIDVSALDDLANSTQFVWQINEIDDDFLALKISPAVNDKVVEYSKKSSSKSIRGFVASTIKPSDLKIRGTNEKASLDLFVNGRLRDKDLLRHIPTARLVENYLYGQIHFDALDYANDAFTSSREGVLNDDPLFNEFLIEIESLIRTIIDEWDELRRKIGKDGDPDNPAVSRKRRKAQELFNATADEIIPENPDKTVSAWVLSLGEEAQFNIPSYAECFIAENLLRKYIVHKSIPLSREATESAKKWKEREQTSKAAANIAFEVRQSSGDLQYLSMDDLANLVDKPASPTKDLGIARDAKVYKPTRDAVAHTSLVTEDAKLQLTTVFTNIKARLKQLLGAS